MNTVFDEIKLKNELLEQREKDIQRLISEKQEEMQRLTLEMAQNAAVHAWNRFLLDEFTKKIEEEVSSGTLMPIV